MQEEQAKEASHAFSVIGCRGIVLRGFLHFASEDDEGSETRRADVVQQEIAHEASSNARATSDHFATA